MKTTLPILLLIILAVLAGGISLLVKPKTELPSAESIIEASAQASLTLQPELTSVKVGEEITYAVLVDAGNKKIIGVEGYFEFDPSVLSITSISPGPLFAQPEELLKIIDPPTHHLTYAVGTRNPVTAKGILFTIHARTLTPTKDQNEPLTFIREKTHVALESESGDKRYAQEETATIFETKQIVILP
ncbi:MAG: cohesin domain-containing protein [Patescibacteria group bacterium]